MLDMNYLIDKPRENNLATNSYCSSYVIKVFQCP